MEWTDPRFVDYIHDDARDKEYATTWGHPTFMLRDLVADDLLCYPTTLCIRGNDYGGVSWKDDSAYYPRHAVNRVTKHSNPEVERALKSFSQSVASLVRTCSYLDEGFASRILNKGNIDATLGFLLTLLPNLTTLKVENDNHGSLHDFDHLRNVIKNVLRNGYRPTTTPRRVSPPLSKLKCVELTKDLHIETYAPLFQLPSIVSIRVDDVRNNNDFRLNCPGFHIEENSHSNFTYEFKVRSYRLFPERYTLIPKSHIAPTS